MPLTRFRGLDEDSRLALRRLATIWRDSPTRPSIGGAEALRWHSVVEQWVRDRTMPLLIQRPRGSRGRPIRHTGGRMLVPVDHSPAMYLLSLALLGRRPSLEELRQALEDGRMPVALRLTPEEERWARYQGTIDTMDAPNLFDLGYSLCHVTQVGLRRGPLLERTEVELVAHSLLLMSPVNTFVVPKEYSGLGHLPEFIDEMDDARAFAAGA